jgi:hypothetical protein
MRALSWIIAAALAAAPALAQQPNGRSNAPRIPQPGPSATSGSDAGPFSGLPDNTPPAPSVIVGIDNGATVAPSPANDVPLVGARSAETLQQVTAEEFDRAEREHRRAAAEMSRNASPIEGAFNGQTDERSR